jgi:uncharacterized protein (TIGR03086 family)
MTSTDVTPIARFDRAAATATAVVDAIRPEQLGDPTPCTEWTVRQLLNHFIGGNKIFTQRLTGGEDVDRSADHVGPDHVASFRASVSALRTAFSGDGVMDNIYLGPLGEAPGRALARIRVNEFMVHAWDLARATGQSTDLDPELAAQCAEDLRGMQEAGRGGAMFAAVQPYPENATVADKLAALAGRTV